MRRFWLTALRREKVWTQAELAERVGTTKPVVSQWETGHKSPSRDNLMRLADCLGPSVLEQFAAEARSRKGAA